MKIYNNGDSISYRAIAHDPLADPEKIITGTVMTVHTGPRYGVRPDGADTDVQLYVPCDHVVDHTPTTSMRPANDVHYHAGWNVPGYLPTTEFQTFDNAEEAVNYLIDQLNENGCDCTLSYDDDTPCDTCMAIDEINGIIADCDGYERGLAVLHPDENLVYCMHVCASTHRETADIRVGRMFKHGHFINGDYGPALCRITQVTPLTVYYRVNVEDDAPGSRFQCAPEYFLKESLGDWVQ